MRWSWTRAGHPRLNPRYLGWVLTSICFIPALVEASRFVQEGHGADDLSYAGKFLYADASSQTNLEVYPVVEYQIHLAPSEDYMDESEHDNEGDFDLSRFKDEDETDLSHVRPFFLTDNPANGPRVVKFYSPWCGHCKQLKPRYVQLARDVNNRVLVTTPVPLANPAAAPQKKKKKKKKRLAVHFYAVSCSEYHDICKRYSIKGYPTVMAYKSGSLDGIRLNLFTPQEVADALGLNLAGDKVSDSETSVDTENKDAENSTKITQQKHNLVGEAREGWVRKQEDVYVDAALSFTFALRTAVYPGGGSRSPTLAGPLEPLSRKAALIDFLDLLYWALPPTWRIHTLINDLRSNLDHITSGKENLIHFIDVHFDVTHEPLLKTHQLGPRPPLTDTKEADPTSEEAQTQEAAFGYQWSSSCSHGTPDRGYTCGLWNLLHIVTVGVSERHRSVLGGGLDRVSTRYAAKTIKNFIEHFLACQVCQERFVFMYDSCQFDLCHRMTDHPHVQRHKQKQKKKVSTYEKETLQSSTVSEEAQRWRELALWLWEVHNEFNVQILNEEAQLSSANSRGYSTTKITPEQENAVRWPSSEKCPKCWLNDKKNGESRSPGTNTPRWDSDAVYMHLREEYWPSGVHNFRWVVLDKKQYDEPEDSENWNDKLAPLLPKIIMAAFLVGSIMSWLKGRRIARTGWHKKNESEV